MFGWVARLLGLSQSEAPAEREFFSSVAGVSHRNRDRTSRQKIIREDVYAGMLLKLRLEDDNKFDKNAVAVETPSGAQIGYLNSRLASDVRGWLAEGMPVVIRVDDVTGGDSDKPMRGVNIHVQVLARAPNPWDAPVPPATPPGYW